MKNYEIERKYLVRTPPKDLSAFPRHDIEQAISAPIPWCASADRTMNIF